MVQTYIYKNLLNNNRFLILFSLLAMLLYIFPLLFLGEGAYVQVFDNLDIAIPNTKVLVHSGMLFAPSDTIIPNIMGGLPRLSYGSELNGYVWLHYFFPSFSAFVINEVLMHMVAYVSMGVLLSRYFVPSSCSYRLLIIHSTSLMFALLPFYSGAGLSVPSVPLALYAFLNIRQQSSKWSDWVIIIAIPFYSSLFLVYFFFLLVMSGLLIIDTIKNKNINWSFVFGLAVMSIAFIIVEYRLFYDMFIQHLFVSHRIEFGFFQTNSLWDTYKTAHGIFLNGSVDMDTKSSAIIIPFIFLTIAVSVLKKKIPLGISIIVISIFFTLLFNQNILVHITGNKFTMPILIVVTAFLYFYDKPNRLFFSIIILQIFFSYWYALWFSAGAGEMAMHYSILKEFNFARIVLLQPLFWGIITALGMAMILKRFSLAPLLIVGVVLSQIYLSFTLREYSSPRKSLSYHSYYAVNLFKDLKMYIGKDPSTYRVGSLALDPAVTIYNGFYTIDGYMTSYPLEYKNKFYKIIKESLYKHDEDSELFLHWGSKCYLLDGGEPVMHYERNATIKRLKLNMRAFHDLGGEYLISSHEIEKSQSKNLIFEKKFTDKETFWNIYLYRVDLSKE
jgi:hypothetical protein